MQYNWNIDFIQLVQVTVSPIGKFVSCWEDEFSCLKCAHMYTTGSNSVTVCLPRHLRVLTHTQQDGLGIEEEAPAGETEQQEDDDAPLKDHSHPA